MRKENEREIIAYLSSNEPWTYVPEPNEVKPDPRSGVVDRDNSPEYTSGVWQMDFKKGQMVKVSHDNVTAAVSEPATPAPEPMSPMERINEKAAERAIQGTGDDELVISVVQ